MGWMTYIAAFAAALFGALSILGAFAAHRNAQAALEAQPDVARLLRQLRELNERVEALEAVLTKIDARDRMRRVRAARGGDEDSSAPSAPALGSDEASKARWKAEMRRKLQLGQLRHEPGDSAA